MSYIDKLSDNLRYLLTGALIFIILVGMHETAYLINMVVISLILAMLGTPLLFRLKRRGFSDVISVTIIMTVYIIVIFFFLALIFESVNVLLMDLPKYEELFTIRMQGLFSLIGNLGVSVSADSLFLPDWGTLSKILLGLAGNVSAILMDGFFIIVITCFILLEIPSLPRRIKKLAGEDSSLLVQYREMCTSMIGWVVVKTKTNVVLGASFGAMLYALGIDLAVFWGVMAVILSYIPYIGLLIVSVPAIILAWLQLGLWGVVIVVIGICIINAVVENIVFSKFAAKDFNMPPLVVILSLVLWTWVLGPIGMLISVPLTIMILIAFRYIESTKWITVILGMEDIPEKTKPEK
ncbi:putative PurR-regulated permease PerM [Methanomicrobium sp. W14]|uniref:AI-2E family transporter n=1 Tax=Methanomicrobium sp. W14 TaxID=2817839 RepID=UPI001AE85356|nr:AI-2E family transporter [Methanomicrobium sp. W14]MBP2132670.1 putative PurR-regulated permease PerM [Methanomicrobium sp. W14]